MASINSVTINYGTPNRALISAEGKYFVAEFTNDYVKEIFDSIIDNGINGNGKKYIITKIVHSRNAYYLSYTEITHMSEDYQKSEETTIPVREIDVVKIKNIVAGPPEVLYSSNMCIIIGDVDNFDVDMSMNK